MEKTLIAVSAFLSGLMLGVSALIGGSFGFFLGLISFICGFVLIFCNLAKDIEN